MANTRGRLCLLRVPSAFGREASERPPGQHSIAQHGVALHSAAQHRTAEHENAQHCTALHCTAKRGTAEHCTANTIQHLTATHLTALNITALHYNSTAHHIQHITQHDTAHSSTPKPQHPQVTWRVPQFLEGRNASRDMVDLHARIGSQVVSPMSVGRALRTDVLDNDSRHKLVRPHTAVPRHVNNQQYREEEAMHCTHTRSTIHREPRAKHCKQYKVHNPQSRERRAMHCTQYTVHNPECTVETAKHCTGHSTVRDTVRTIRR